jgi:hypothetical protein
MTEKEMEDLLWEYPEKFLFEKLQQFRRQAVSQVGRTDLVFSDSVGRLLVVELKRGKLPRGAVEQLHDYFGMLKREFPGKPVELMVLANSIPEERRLACEHLSIEAREISEKRFRDVASEVGYVFRSELPQEITSSQPAVAGVKSGTQATAIRRVGPNKIKKGWYVWHDSAGKKFYLAMVNAKGNCSMRLFDGTSGAFLQRIYRDSDFQDSFAEYISVGKSLSLTRQPNLEKHCRPGLPTWVLNELNSAAE